MRVNIYIATSLKALKRQNGTVGFVVEAQTHPEPVTFTQFGAVKEVTRDQSLLLALKFALKKVKEGNEIHIFTDSKYLEAAFGQKWTGIWVENGFKNAKGKDIANKTEWLDVLEALKGQNATVHLDEQNGYRDYLDRETERRAKKYV